MGGVLLTADALNDELIESVLIITFSRPEIRSPLSIGVLTGLENQLDRAAVSAEVKAVVFTGMNDVFASGADLKEIAQVGAESAADFALRGQRLMKKIADLGQPTIAAVNGYCFGGALDLALACDRRIASANALFAHPGAGLGIITGWGGTQRLPRLIGTANAFEMLFTASPIDAERAVAIGLVDEIAGDVVQSSMELARALL